MTEHVIDKTKTYAYLSVASMKTGKNIGCTIVEVETRSLIKNQVEKTLETYGLKLGDCHVALKWITPTMMSDSNIVWDRFYSEAPFMMSGLRTKADMEAFGTEMETVRVPVSV